MSISFRCERCHKDVKAPDAAAGKRGKCPFCGETTYIPLPVSDDELLPLAPIDEAEERRLAEERKALHQQAKELLAEDGSGPEVPLEHKDAANVTSGDLHHFVINFCIDLAEGQLDRAETYIPRLRKYGPKGREAIDDFLSGRVLEPALDRIPGRVLQGFLAQLRDRVRE